MFVCCCAGQYSKEHAFGSLNGSDNMVSFSTRRYCNTPLVVRGPGAGAEVTGERSGPILTLD